MKKIFHTLSFAMMICLFVTPFVDNQILNNIYTVNEFMHWLQIPILLLAILATDKMKTKGGDAEQIKSTKKMVNSRKYLYVKIVKRIDFIALLFLAFYVGDFSFALALAICMVLISWYEKTAKDFIEKINNN